MEMMLWIFLCLFASVGIVQCGMWFWQSFKKPSDVLRGYRVIPLKDDPDCLEARLRISFTADWRESGDIILFADMGLGEECRKICEHLLNEMGSACICDISDVPIAIKRFEDLQNRADDVE
jgi:hypothetical protein